MLINYESITLDDCLENYEKKKDMHEPTEWNSNRVRTKRKGETTWKE